MAKQLFANNASAILAASISDADLTIQLQNGFGQFYPNPGADEYFLATLENDEGDIEIVKITARSTDLLTVPPAGRGQEGTSAQAWTNGQARVECRITKVTLDTFIQRGGDAMAGDLNMDGNEVQDAIFTGSGTRMEDGEIVGVPIRGVSGDDSNELAVPADGSRATAGGSPILTEGDAEGVATAAFEVGMMMVWYGSHLSPPAGWAIANGTNGTPDMRGKFPLGALAGTYEFDSAGGSATLSGNTGAAGGHSHGGTTGGTAITEAQMPPHDHDSSGQITLPFTNDDNSQKPATAVGGSSVQIDGTNTYNATFSVGSAGSGEEHAHSIATADNHEHSLAAIACLPPYKAVHWIMFIGF